MRRNICAYNLIKLKNNCRGKNCVSAPIVLCIIGAISWFSCSRFGYYINFKFRSIRVLPRLGKCSLIMWLQLKKTRLGCGLRSIFLKFSRKYCCRVYCHCVLELRTTYRSVDCKLHLIYCYFSGVQIQLFFYFYLSFLILLVKYILTIR